MIKIHLDGCFRRTFKSSFSREPQYAICCDILLGFDILLNFHQVKKLRTGKWRFTYWKKPSFEAPKKHPSPHGEDMLPPNFPSPTWCPLGKRSKKEFVGCCLFRDALLKVKTKSCRVHLGCFPTLRMPLKKRQCHCILGEGNRVFSALIKQGMIRGDTPRKRTWSLKRMVSKRNLLFQGSIFRFHVKFRGSIPKNMFFSLVFCAMDNMHLAQRMYRLTIFTVYTYHNSLLAEATLHVILLMEETLHQLRLVVYPISEPSTVRHVIKLYPKAPCEWNIYLHLP